MTQRQWRTWGRVMGIAACLLLTATHVRRALYELAPGESVRAMPVTSAAGGKTDLAATMPGEAVWFLVDDRPEQMRAIDGAVKAIRAKGTPAAVICVGGRDCAATMDPAVPVYTARGKIARVAVGDLELPAVVVKDSHNVVRSITKCCDLSSLAVKVPIAPIQRSQI